MFGSRAYYGHPADGQGGIAHLQQAGQKLQIYVKKMPSERRDSSSTSCSIWAITSASAGIYSARAPEK